MGWRSGVRDGVWSGVGWGSEVTDGVVGCLHIEERYV